MRIVFFLGETAVGHHGQIIPERLYDERALTGTESHTFNLARGLAGRGHEIYVFCPTPSPVEREGVWFIPISINKIPAADAYISVSEPDILRKIPHETALRINIHQLGDFYHSPAGFEKHVDVFAFVSPGQMKHALTGFPQVPREKSIWLPNTINPEFYNQNAKRKPHTAAWLSSSDRGLHRLMEIWPSIRRQIPDAELRIYYRFQPWYEQVKDQQSPFGDRARYIANALNVLGSKGEHGVYLMDAVPPTKLLADLSETQVVPYTFDPIAYTETFCVALLDACAAGCVPITSDLDALGDIYKDVAHIIPGRPQESREKWTQAIIRAMTDESWASSIREKARPWSQAFHRQRVATAWESFLANNIGRRGKTLDTSMISTTVSEYVEKASVSPITAAPIQTPDASVKTAPVGQPAKNQPTVSVLVMLSRPGGMDITFAALRDQTFKDFETILVDNRYEKRHQSVMKMAARYGLKNVFHVPEHRRNGKWIVACAAFNTAIMMARGKYVIILHDFTYAPPGWIESHLQELEKKPKRLVVGNHQNVDMPELETPVPLEDSTDRPCLDSDRAFEGQNELCIFKRGVFDPSWLPLPIGPKQWQPGYSAMFEAGDKPDRTWITLTNDSIDREFLWDLGGIDERFDFGRGPFDINLGQRIAEAGGDVVWVHKPIVPILNPRFAFRTKPYGDPNVALEGRWTKQDAYVYEQIIEQRKDVKANNPYDMRQLAAELELWRKPSYGPLAREISDSVYWSQIIRPETPPLPPVKHPPITVRSSGGTTGAPGPTVFDTDFKPFITPTGTQGIPQDNKAPAIITNRRPAVSVLVPAYRPGGIDITFESMRNQTFKDFEIIMVDRRYEKRHALVMEAARKYGLPVIHTPEHRRNGPWITAATAYNTAAALAAGHKIVFLHEWWYAPPRWLEEHMRLLEGHPQAISLTGYITREPPALATKKPFSFETGRELVWDRATDQTQVTNEDEVLSGEILDEIYAFKDGPFSVNWLKDLKTIKDVAYRPSDNWQQDCRPEMYEKGTKPNHSWSIMCNDGMHLDWFARLGGHDELFDKTKGLFDVEFSSRARKAGGEFLWSPNVLCVSIRPQKIARTRPCGGMNERIGNRWSNTDGENYYKKQMESPRTRAKNPIDILDMPRRLQHWRHPNAERVPIDIPDIAYWGKDPMWPEDLPEDFFKDE